MTRFNSNARLKLAYEPTQKPFEQLVGLYNMWQSISPRTREWLASLFRRKNDANADHRDVTAAMTQSPEAAKAFIDGWDYSIGDVNGHLAEAKRIADEEEDGASMYSTRTNPVDGSAYKQLNPVKFVRGMGRPDGVGRWDDVDTRFADALDVGRGMGIAAPRFGDDWTSIDPYDKTKNSKNETSDQSDWEAALKAAERLGMNLDDLKRVGGAQ